MHDLIIGIKKLISDIQRYMNTIRIYNTARSMIGRDASPSDKAPDELGCAETVSTIIRNALPELKFPLLLSTREMYLYLINSPSFVEIQSPEAGDIIISPTGSGNGTLRNGHVGICGRHKSPDGTNYIISNDSRTGTLEASFTLKSWRSFYEARGGMPVVFFRVT